MTDVALAYQLLLGRAAETRALCEGKATLAAADMVAAFFASEEFEYTVLQPLRGGGEPRVWREPFVQVEPQSALLRFSGLDLQAVSATNNAIERLSIVLGAPEMRRALAAALGDAPAVEVLGALDRRLRAGEATRSPARAHDRLSATDLRMAYGLFLGRAPEYGLPEDASAIDGSLRALVADLLASVEFRLSFFEPIDFGETLRTVAFYETPGADLIAWVEARLVMEAGTRRRLRTAETVADLVLELLWDRRFAALYAAPVLKSYARYPAAAQRAPATHARGHPGGEGTPDGAPPVSGPGLSEASTALAEAEAAAALGAFPDAFRRLERITDRGDDARWRKGVSALIDAAFADACARSRPLYAADRRGEADALLDDAVTLLASRIARFEPHGPLLPSDGSGRVVMLANLDLPQCAHYRVEQKVELFERLGRPFQVYARDQVDAFISALPGASAAIIYREAAWPGTVRAILAARAFGVPTIYEVDDLIFDAAVYPAPLSSFSGQIEKVEYDNLAFGVPLFRGAMALCDAAIASTEPLRRRMAEGVRTGRAWVVPNGLDSRIRDADQATGRSDDEVVIFYGTGTRAHSSDFDELLAPALTRVLQRNPNVQLLLVGHLAIGEGLSALAGQATHVPGSLDLQTYWRLLQTADINLSVLTAGAFADCKSEIKWLEAAYFGIASIVSPTATYRSQLQEGREVLFAETGAEWEAALQRLIDDAALRRDVAGRARAKADGAYSLDACAQALQAALDGVEQGRAKTSLPTKRKRRLMLAHVFFPPQAIGGATRVVRNNLDDWLDLGLSEQFEFAVFTTDEGHEDPGRVRVDGYRGVPVFRVTTPAELNMEWRPFNDRMGEAFARVHALWRPDLVHFHCMQRLTASPVQVCQALATKSLITVHDAWWISDYQFLVDARGALVDYRDDARPPAPPAQVSREASNARRDDLMALLAASDRVLAVSDAFRAVYQSAGVETATSVPNGLPPMKAHPRTPSSTGRVRLAHVGGMAAHKGYFLLRHVLCTGAYSNLTLTVVDHRRTGGPVERAVWGATPVSFVGKTPQDAMGDLYAAHDVLMAVSTWPESYGLVAREASACGLWVVASDRGAMGEDVRSGENGYVVDVSTPDPLAAVLRAMDRDPEAYLQPAKVFPMRTARDQALDLMEIYQAMLDD